MHDFDSVMTLYDSVMTVLNINPCTKCMLSKDVMTP